MEKRNGKEKLNGAKSCSNKEESGEEDVIKTGTDGKDISRAQKPDKPSPKMTEDIKIDRKKLEEILRHVLREENNQTKNTVEVRLNQHEITLAELIRGMNRFYNATKTSIECISD